MNACVRTCCVGGGTCVCVCVCVCMCVHVCERVPNRMYKYMCVEGSGKHMYNIFFKHVEFFTQK